MVRTSRREPPLCCANRQVLKFCFSKRFSYLARAAGPNNTMKNPITESAARIACHGAGRLQQTCLELTQPEQPASPLVFLTATEMAAFLRISLVTLGRWRIGGCGPAYRKFGRRVVYAQADLTAWAEAQRRASTSEQIV
jgi:hypothetical protein